MGLAGRLTSAPQRSQVTSTAGSTTGQPAQAPASFNPLVLPVNFGWLPAGFTENLPAPGEFPMSQGPLEVMTTQVTFGASTPGGEGLQVTVAARGVKVNPWIGGETSSPAQLAFIGSAPDINGHPAKWLAGGLEWSTRPGAGDHPHRRRNRGPVQGGLGTELQDQHPQDRPDTDGNFYSDSGN